MNRFDVWLVMKNPEKGRVVDNLGLCAIVTLSRHWCNYETW